MIIVYVMIMFTASIISIISINIITVSIIICVSSSSMISVIDRIGITTVILQDFDNNS